MDVQTENADPPPPESQPSGKIRKGFKLFGKRKPGNIFSIRGKGDGNNKSPVIRSKTLEGLPETEAPDSEQEPDKEKGPEGNQGDSDQAEDEQHVEDGVLAAARHSISSTSSARSLSFLSLLRGGRRGGDRRVHTVSQPVGRHRRGLKGLFSSVKFRPKDKEDTEEKEDAPPSPLLMSSRVSSVEIIKEDLTLTPKSHSRSPDSPETESFEQVKSLTSQDSSATSPSQMITPQMITPQMTADGSVSRTDEHVPPLPTSEPPMIPGETSLSTLLADISSLLTFDSISGGGDIMADVEAEWGKASCAISSTGTAVTASASSLVSKPAITSPMTSTSISTSSTEQSSVAVTTPAPTQCLTSAFKTPSASSPVAKPSTIITTYTRSSTLTSYSVKSSSDAALGFESSPRTTIKSSLTAAAAKPPTTPVTVVSVSAPVMSSPTIRMTTTPSFPTTTTSAPLTTMTTVVRTTSCSPTLTSSMSSKRTAEMAAPQIVASGSKPCPVVPPPLPSLKNSPATDSPPTSTCVSQPPPAELEGASTLNSQTCASSGKYPPKCSEAREAKVAESTPMTAGSAEIPVPVTKHSPVPVHVPVPVSTPAPVSFTVTTSTPTPTLAPKSKTASEPAKPTDLNKNLPSCESTTGTSPSPVQVVTTSNKTQPSAVSVPPPDSSSTEKISPVDKHSSAPVCVDKMPPAPTPVPTPDPQAVVPTASTTSSAPDPIKVSLPSIGASAQISLSVSKEPRGSAEIPVPVTKHSPVPVHVPVPVSTKDSPPCLPVSIPTDLPTPVPASVPKGSPAPTEIPLSQSKVATLPQVSTSLQSEAPVSSKIRGQASVDKQLLSSTCTDTQGAQTVPCKTEDSGSPTSVQGPSKERRTPQGKAPGLSKIPVVGGGKVGKLPVRDSQHVCDETSREPPTPVLDEEKSYFNSHDTSKHSQEESQQPPQPKGLTSLPRDSKIPVKHSAHPHAACQFPHAKETPRTKIPVSKVPVRRVANKSAAAGGSGQTRK